MKEIRVKQTNLKTDGNFWLLNGEPYFGSYHTWTDGTAMTKSSFNRAQSKKLELSIHAKNIVQYDILTEKKQRGKKYAMQERPRPTKNDYKSGKFKRYFVRKSSDKDAIIFEVASTTISKLKTGYYDNISLLWKLTGPIIDEFDSTGARITAGVKSTNNRIIKKMNIKMPGLKHRLSNHLEYYRPGKNK